MFSVERVSHTHTHARTRESYPRSRREIALANIDQQIRQQTTPLTKGETFFHGRGLLQRLWYNNIFVRAKRGPDYMKITFVPRPFKH